MRSGKYEVLPYRALISLGADLERDHQMLLFESLGHMQKAASYNIEASELRGNLRISFTTGLEMKVL